MGKADGLGSEAVTGGRKSACCDAAGEVIAVESWPGRFQRGVKASQFGAFAGSGPAATPI